MRSQTFLVAILLLIPACQKPTDQRVEDPSVGATEPYEGFQQDRADLRDTILLKDQNIRGSSGKAQAAAKRIFSQITFVGMSKDQVLRLLGDPKTISDYGEEKGEGADDPLVYRFDAGDSGYQWTIFFREGTVVEVEEAGLY